MSNGNKIVTFEEAVTRIQEAQAVGSKAVLAQGVFDLLHIGHLEFLLEAKSYGDILFVATHQDETIRLNKGETRPFHPLSERLTLLGALECVDFVFAYNESVHYATDSNQQLTWYKTLKPDVLAITVFDTNLELKSTQARQANIPHIAIVGHNQQRRMSTTKILKLIGHE